jgi:hypothetical protein
MLFQVLLISSLHLFSLIMYPATDLRDTSLYITMLCSTLVDEACKPQDSHKCTSLCFYYQEIPVRASKSVKNNF